MRILISVIFVLLTVNHVCAQVFYCPNATSWHQISDTQYVELSAEVKQHIRKKAMHHHQLYLQFYKNEDRRLARRQNQLCRLLNREFVDLHEVFPKASMESFIPEPQLELNTDKPFLLFHYASFHFNQYRFRHAITKIEVNIWPNAISLYGYFPQGVQDPSYKRKHPEIRPTYNETGWQDTSTGNIYHFDNACIFSPLYIEIPADTLGDTMKYALYKFHERSNLTVGVVAVNIADSSDLHFLAGPFIPLGFDVPISKFIAQLAQRSMEDPLHSNWVKNDFIKELGLDENFDFTWFNGVLEYAKLIASKFMYMPKHSKMLEYKDGYYTVEVAAGFHFISSHRKNRKRYCKKITASPGEPYRGEEMRMLHGKKTIFVHGINAPPYLLCSDFNGRVVSNMHIRINPETGDVQLKIMDTANLRRVSVCPQRN